MIFFCAIMLHISSAISCSSCRHFHAISPRMPAPLRHAPFRRHAIFHAFIDAAISPLPLPLLMLSPPPLMPRFYAARRLRYALPFFFAISFICHPPPPPPLFSRRRRLADIFAILTPLFRFAAAAPFRHFRFASHADFAAAISLSPLPCRHCRLRDYLPPPIFMHAMLLFLR
jgi:hypothetical protein